MTIAINPNPKQLEFFRARERFVAYGGARGGGKSWAIRQKARLLALRWPGIRILILRRSFPELQENHILPLLSDLRGLAQYRASEKAFLFPGGSRIKFGYCDRERDVDQYQGQEYDVIFLDEATQFTEYQYITLTPCIRGANDFPKRMYLTCNPGGVGHMWVKRLFVDRGPGLPQDAGQPAPGAAGGLERRVLGGVRRAVLPRVHPGEPCGQALLPPAGVAPLPGL